MEFSPVVVRDYLSGIDDSKACGPAEFLLKLCAESLYLCHYHICIQSHWSLVPCHVTGSQPTLSQFTRRVIASNYRPISLTSVVIKIMERIIHSQITSCLEAHGHISNHQYGFRIDIIPQLICYWKLLMIGLVP